ncbi:type II secretion system F family protein [Halobacillus seohaensis]|uniref:Type II secretion system F family protein n=1 Tax=Halobacillus seohaensis TaxID=447421 RepID=A0ABW2EE77_9BACI
MHSAIRKINTRLSKRSTIPLLKQIRFLNRLCKLLYKGFPLLEALKMTSWDAEFKNTTNEITRQLNIGNPLDIAFQEAHFSKQVVSYLYFSRIHYDLPEMFKQCADLLEMQHEYTKKIKEALRYPLLLFAFVTVAFTVIKQTILPSFQTLFDNGGTKPFSLVILNIVDIMITGVGFIIIIALLLFLLFHLMKNRLSIEQTLFLYEKLPIVKSYKMFSLTFLFSTHLSALVATGLTLKNSLEVISTQPRYPHLSHYGLIILKHLNNGQQLGASLQDCRLLRPELTSIFHHTNDLRTLSEELQVLSEMLVDQFKEKLTKIIQLIQPIFFIGVALVVILIYASIMLPLYQWMKQI